MTEQIPEILRDLLTAHYQEEAERILQGFCARRETTLRVNRMKATPDELRSELEEAGIPAIPVPWFPDAFRISSGQEPAIRALSAYTEGRLYLQSLSSMIPPILLDPRPGEDVLDMCAAPGGKTTQLVSLSNGKANVTAVEKDRIRSERLRYNLQRQGVTRVPVLQQDARKLDDHLRFDKILLDAPCSGSGTVLASDPKTSRAFSEELVRNSARLQSELLRKAVRLVKQGGIIVYSTCSVLPEENERVILPFLKKGTLSVVACAEPDLSGHLLPCEVPGAFFVCPDAEYEGFFAVCLKKN